MSISDTPKRWFSKLPIRQVTLTESTGGVPRISKLPIRQVTAEKFGLVSINLSKLPIRQVT